MNTKTQELMFDSRIFRKNSNGDIITTKIALEKSAKGLMRVENENGIYVMYDQQTTRQEATGALQTVFKDGKLTKFQTLEEIRKVLWK